ncbi:MAG: carboxylate-amine ligase [Arenicellales bacterium]|nr:carboxylate-amine ligase [Arenicellales bacterium]MDP7490535.1 carboxylate-amine ligase [Arenicellales bacterium]MDP7564171.1 carboxylate-amine ligase [Arenicellales bacterium]
MTAEPSFTIGVEEEYLMVDQASHALIRQAPDGLMEALTARLGDQVSPEFLQCQVEVCTRVCGPVSEVREDLLSLRQAVIEVIAEFGLSLVAASTHPYAIASELEHTHKTRYDDLAQDMQQVVRRMLICGMHVHVGIEDDELRVDLLGQAAYIIPHLLALSTSSPFWEGENTGLQSYRISIWDEMPRTGLPESFDSYAEYQRYVDVLVNAGIIEDATKIWWDLRPSERFPTLEMRAPDVCTSIDDAICIAALYRCWLRMLYRLRQDNQRWRRYASTLIAENRWRAQRYGSEASLIDFGRGELVAYSSLIEEMLELIRTDAEHFGCVAEVEYARVILQRGTSAQRQVTVYQQALAGGADQRQALDAVLDWLVAETMRIPT